MPTRLKDFRRYQVPVKLSSEWVADYFQFPTNPFIIDVGCSKGNWAVEYGAKYDDVNVLGIDIREQVVEIARARTHKEQLKNVNFISTNANVDICRILDDINKLSHVKILAVQFPDPHFKSSHRKRRVVNQQFVEDVCSRMPPGAQICLQSDVEDVMHDMVETCVNLGNVTPADGYDKDTLLHNPNPFSVLTAREMACNANGNYDIYRMLFNLVR